jgi:hypothetical protein
MANTRLNQEKIAFELLVELIHENGIFLNHEAIEREVVFYENLTTSKEELRSFFITLYGHVLKKEFPVITIHTHGPLGKPLEEKRLYEIAYEVLLQKISENRIDFKDVKEQFSVTLKEKYSYSPEKIAHFVEIIVKDMYNNACLRD